MSHWLLTAARRSSASSDGRRKAEKPQVDGGQTETSPPRPNETSPACPAGAARVGSRLLLQQWLRLLQQLLWLRLKWLLHGISAAMLPFGDGCGIPCGIGDDCCIAMLPLGDGCGIPRENPREGHTPCGGGGGRCGGWTN